MPFNLINVNEGGAVVLGDNGLPLSFEDGRAAAAAAAELGASTGARYQPRRVVVDDSVWHQREQSRFDSNAYRHLLFRNEDWYRECEAVRFHFAHVSQDDPAKVAFTADNEKGQADVQTSMRVGRYLEQFFPDLPREYRERITREHVLNFVQQALQITQDAARIEWVYTNGPHSCMAYPRTDVHHYVRGIPCHPTAPYGDCDLALAYLLSEGDDTRVAARCIVWPERRIFTRVYGDMRLHSVLVREGWTQGSIDGARVRKIMYRNDIISPYFDSGDWMRDAGDHLIVDRRGSVYVRNTSGVATVHASETCVCCNETQRASGFENIGSGFDVVSRRVDRVRWCSSCVSTHRALLTRSSRYGGYALRTAPGSMRPDGHYWYDTDWANETASREQREAVEAERRVRQAAERAAYDEEQRVERERLHRLAQEASDRSVRRVAVTRARRDRQLAEQGVGDGVSFMCPVAALSFPWSEGVDVRTILEDGSVVSHRWSRVAAQNGAERCRINRHLYRVENIVWHNSTRMNRNTAATRGWVDPAPRVENYPEIEILLNVEA